MGKEKRRRQERREKKRRNREWAAGRRTGKGNRGKEFFHGQINQEHNVF